MTTLSPTRPEADSPRAETAAAPATAVYPLAARVAAILLPLGGILMTISVPLDPPPTSAAEPRGTIEAYTAAPERMDVAATILHNGFLLLGIGLLLAGFSIAGRGRWLAVIGGLAAGIGFMDLSGAVLIDWFHAASGRVVGVDAAVRIDEASQMPVVSAGWLIPMALGAALGPILLLVGLARAKVVGWWILAFPVVIVAVALSGVLEGPLGGAVAFGLVALLGAVLGVGLWRASAGGPATVATG